MSTRKYITVEIEYEPNIPDEKQQYVGMIKEENVVVCSDSISGIFKEISLSIEVNEKFKKANHVDKL